MFSPDRRYRYSLRHRWADLFAEKAICWIGLNPSTAKEDTLDPTLNRIKGFSTAWGYNCFFMLNLFAFRSTDPRDMMLADDPVGPDNDRLLIETAHRCGVVVAAWGVHGEYQDRANQVCRLLEGVPLMAIGVTQAGAARHPLYTRADSKLTAYKLAYV